MESKECNSLLPSSSLIVLKLILLLKRKRVGPVLGNMHIRNHGVSQLCA